ncbi:hypothetical protein NK8_83290 (plasmid) [Caballeronia sp. NK8]|nr:hypothetical protein NK8_83290 [Caballeronia sp. NK8]
MSKEGLYVAVLEAMYAPVCGARGKLGPVWPATIRRDPKAGPVDLGIFAENPQWLNLVNNENLHEARYLERSRRLRETISPVVDLLRSILERGTSEGQFRSGVDPIDFYVTLVGMGYYIVSNRFTLEAFTGRNYSDLCNLESISTLHVDMLLAYLRGTLPHELIRPSTSNLTVNDSHSKPILVPLFNRDDETGDPDLCGDSEISEYFSRLT